MANTTNNTLVKIQTVTVGSGGASSIDFTSIPQTYTDLVIKLSARFNSSNTLVKITYNSNTSSYTRRQLVGENSSASSYSASDAFVAYIDGTDQTASTFSNTEIYIPNYTSSNYKSSSIDTVKENNSSTAWVAALNANLWSNTAAITSISLSDLSGTASFVQYTTATLYGVSVTGSGTTTPKATGGIISSDLNYIYHTFTAAGTFTPSTSLTCDYLIVAGGGGGGWYTGGGGGAGGLIYQTGQTLSATGYGVTVGGGGSGAPGTASNKGSNGSDSTFNSLTATGGGAGGVWGNTTSRNASNGGSGGGSTPGNGLNNPFSGSGIVGQGFDGGTGSFAGGGSPYRAGGGGGGWGAAGGAFNGGTVTVSPGAGGNAVKLNGYTITWVSGNTTRVYGAVS